MVQGSRVTTSVRPVNRQDRSRRDASRSARSSACAVGSCLISRSLPADRQNVPGLVDHDRADRHIAVRRR